MSKIFGTRLSLFFEGTTSLRGMLETLTGEDPLSNFNANEFGSFGEELIDLEVTNPQVGI